MPHIFDLFDHIIEIIFKNLSRQDRLKCKKVCKRWYNYLMEIPSFRDDRHIYLPDDCRVEDPLLIFSAAKGSYDKLTVKHVDEIYDFGQLARVLGNKGLKKVYFDYTNAFTVYQMLPELSLIECLTILLYDIQYLKFHNISDQIFFGNLKNIKIIVDHSNYIILKNFFDMEFPALQKLIPKEATINFLICILKLDEWTSDIEDQISASNVKFGLNNVEISWDCTSKSLSEFKKGNFMFDELKIEKPQLFMKNNIDLLLKQTENIKEISVKIENFSDLHNLTPASIQKITELSIDGYYPCTGEHQTFHLPLLAVITVGKIDCEECLNAILNSFLPKLKSLQIIDPLFLRNLENLECLAISSTRRLNAALFQNPLPSLRSLTISPITLRNDVFEVTVKAIEDIGKLCPQLEILKIHFFCFDNKICINPSLDHLKDILTTEFDNLKTFHIQTRDYELNFLKKSGVVEMKRELK